MSEVGSLLGEIGLSYLMEDMVLRYLSRVFYLRLNKDLTQEIKIRLGLSQFSQRTSQNDTGKCTFT